MLDENRRVFAKFGSARARWAHAAAAQVTARTDAAAASAAIVPTVGVVNKVYVKNALSGSCTAVDSIGARTVAVGQHVIVLADTNLTSWPQALRPDSSFYQTFATEYDQVTWPHILANVGDPLAFDAVAFQRRQGHGDHHAGAEQLSGATGGGSVVAFVNGCDFFPFADERCRRRLQQPDRDVLFVGARRANGYDVATGKRASVRRRRTRRSTSSRTPIGS